MGTMTESLVLAPIAGVRLELYAEITKAVACRFLQYAGDDRPGRWTPQAVAAGRGVPSAAWDRAQAGWAERIRTDPDVAARFVELYLAS